MHQSMTQPRDTIKLIGKILGALVLTMLGVLILAATVIGIAYLRANVTNGEIQSSGEARKYLLYVPSTYEASRPTPLVISIHGFVEWPAHQAQISRWNDLAEQAGFLVVYPEGTGFPRRWRAGGWPGDPMIEVRYISDLIDALAGEYNIDRARVYANGLSNGGGMSYLLGCALSDRIAAIGGVAGAYVYPLDECRPSRPVPMIVFHGTADPIVPFLGGESGGTEARLPVIPEWVTARAALNGCDPTPVELPGSGA